MRKKWPGALEQREALLYMQCTEDLVIVDVAATRWFNREHFREAVRIPIEELCEQEQERLFRTLPADKPVILHCCMG